MINTGFLQNKQVKSLIRFNEYYAFVMMVVFSLVPYLAMFAPSEFGPLFIGIARLEIYAFLFLGLFQLISYSSFTSDKFGVKDRLSACFYKIINSIKNDKTGLVFIAVYILCFVSAICAFYTGNGFDGQKFTETRMFRGTDFRPDGTLVYTCFLVVYVFSSMIKNKTLKKTILFINIGGFFVVSLVMLQQYFGIIGSAGVKKAGKIGSFMSAIYQNLGIRYGHFYKGITGCFYNANHVAYYAALCSMIISGMLVTSKKLLGKILWGLFAAYSYYIITINNTFGCYLAVIGALIITAVMLIIKDKERSKKKIINAFIPVILFLAVTLLFTVFNSGGNPVTKNFKTLSADVENVATSDDEEKVDDVGSGRLGMWLSTLDMIKEKPLLGWGADNLKSEYVERDRELDRAHNEPLEMMVSNGIPAGILYYIAIAAGLAVFIKNKKYFKEQTRLLPFMACIGYLLSSLVGVFLFYTAGYFFMMLAFAVSNDEAIEQNETKSTNKHKKR